MVMNPKMQWCQNMRQERNMQREKKKTRRGGKKIKRELFDIDYHTGYP